MLEEAYRLLVFWITERERVRIAKERGDERRTWTRDAIIATWRFCNVNRCDDRETRWIFKHVIEAHSDSPVLWFNLVIARLINWSPSLACIGYFDEWDCDRFVKSVFFMQSRNEKVYTGAYMVPAGPSGVAKHVYIADAVLSEMWQCREQVPINGNCQQWSDFLRRFPLMGDFLRNQVITDIRYTHHLRNADDWSSFILPGPGTQRGLNRLFGKPLNQRYLQGAAELDLSILRQRIVAEQPQLAETLRDINNLANCMCEFDKYMRVLNGEGKPRARYTPSSEPLP